jgi:hypothetical protein
MLHLFLIGLDQQKTGGVGKPAASHTPPPEKTDQLSGTLP